ncbi:MAG: DUF6531 domain-containing protein [Janthinobacterium lividum]
MRAPPAQVLELKAGDVTVFLGPLSAHGMGELGSLGVLDKPIETGNDRLAIRALETLKTDSWQIDKLQSWMARSDIAVGASVTVRMSTHHDAHHVVETLRHHLRSHRLRAIVIRNHDRHAVGPFPKRSAAAPVALPAASAAGPQHALTAAGASAQASSTGGRPAPHAPVSIAGWSTSQRLQTLLSDALPLLGKDLQAHIQEMMTGEALTQLIASMVLIAGVQAIPVVGEVVDAGLTGYALAYAGWDGLRAIIRLVKAVRTAMYADSEAGIAAAAPEAAKAMGALGSDFFTMVMLHAAKRNSSGGQAAEATATEDGTASAVNSNRGSGVGGSGNIGTQSGIVAEPASPQPRTSAGGHTSEDAVTAESVGHPVNPATGVVFTEQTDFTLPGPLPLVFRRIWVSSSTIAGELGHGWHHSLDMGLMSRADGRQTLRLGDGRMLVFDTPQPGRPSYDAPERIQLCDIDGEVVAVDYSGIRFRFGPSVGFVPGIPALRHLVSVADPNGNTIILARDRSGRLHGIRDSAGRKLQVRHNALGHIVGIDAPHPDGEGVLTLVSFEYNRAGELTASRDAAGGSFRYIYERHLLVEERRPAGLTFHFRWDNTARRTAARCIATWGGAVLQGLSLFDRTLTYDDAVRRTTVRSPRGAVWQYEWNEQGRVVAIVDAVGRRETRRLSPESLPLAVIRADGATRSRTYDRFGRVVETRDFDRARRVLRYAEPTLDGLVTALPLEITTPTGASEQFVWDERQNLASHTDAGGRTRRFLRDPRGLTLAVQDALGPLRRFGWTERGELAWEASGTGEQRITFGHDELGRISESRRLGEAPTRYVSDLAGRVVEIRRPDGGTVRLKRDPEGRLTDHQDAIGGITRWIYDGLPVPNQRLNPDGSSLEYRYDADLNLVGLTNEKGEPYTLAYNLADQLVEEIGFDGRQRSYQYDTAGFLAAHADAERRGAHYRRDPHGRLLERRHSDGLTDGYAYDAAGALTLAQNAWGQVSFVYGPDGTLLEETSPAGLICHRYDIRGRPVEMALPDGRVIETGYDGEDNVIRVGFGSTTVATFGRDMLGREIERRAGALTTSSEYDPQGRLARQSARADGVQPLIERSYRWDSADRLIETLDLASGVRRYQYDASARLAAVSGDLSEHFAFDPAGNILGASSDSGAGTPGVAIGDRLLMRGDRKFEYDGCGNRVREVRGAGGNVERIYRYRADNQLGKVEERSRLGRRLTSFQYDALGRRTVKESTSWGPVAANDGSDTVHGTTTRTDFVWSGNLLLAESTITADPLATVYLHEPRSFRPLAQIRRTRPDALGTLYHYQLDQLGTPQEVTNDDGRIVWQARFRAWGALVTASLDEVSQPIRFQGQYHDTETGLFYNRYRYYAPDEGCYVQQDPIRLLGGSNVSAYVPSPTGWIDPFGLACAFVDQNGVLNIKNKFEPGSSEDLALQQHVADWNEQIAAQGGTMTRQAVPRSLRDDATAAATSARNADPASYPQGMAAGHIPDVGWGGDPAGPISPTNSAVNSYVGGATQAVPAGTVYNSVQLFR